MFKSRYYILLTLYVVASVIGQFLTTTPFKLFTVGTVVVWLPLSAVTLVPLVDVLRSFTQHAAEQEGRHFKHVAFTMLGLTLSTSALCVMYLGLPVQVFTAVLAAVTIGGVVDVLVFRHMGTYFKNPVRRMAVSNLCATLIGSAVVFTVAFTNTVFNDNPLAKPLADALVGWLTQSIFIWISGLIIAVCVNKVQTKALV